MSFQGSLKELPLPDIIQLVSVSGKTGKFTLTREGEEGVIFLLNGQISHARLGELTGDEAIYALAIWNEGEFVFTPGEEGNEKTISRSNTNLLMEAARRADEWKVLSKKIPSVELVPGLLAQHNRHEQITLTPQEWMLVMKIDGQRSIAEIGKALEISSFEIAKNLYGMITSELVELKKKAARPQPSTPPAAAAPLRPAAAPTPEPAARPSEVPMQDAEVEALIDLVGRIRAVAEQHIGAIPRPDCSTLMLPLSVLAPSP
ncbi:MAG: DUF4388 domain-containing protein [Acidobacteria bacterium]|nr:DUF4388 domain-containing protein [Acidobacteriota bacterium]